MISGLIDNVSNQTSLWEKQFSWRTTADNNKYWSFEFPAQGGGWNNLEKSSTEQYYRFTGDGVAEIVLPSPELFDTDDDLPVIVRMSVVHAIVESFIHDIVFKINNEPIGFYDTIENKDGLFILLKCKASLITSSPTFHLTIITRTAFRPSELGAVVGDSRMLGIAIHSITVERDNNK